jgi:ABC-type antimicrobial peptide transport system permease subunit
MTPTDYIINGLFILVVLRQTRERRLDARSVIAPLALVVFVATHYIRSIPVGGGDLALLACLTAVGLTFGVLSGFATKVRLDQGGNRLAKVGWVAGVLLVAGISSRMLFVFALDHGAGPAIRTFSITHQIGAAAWPVALVSMALFEVTARIVIVHVRGHRLSFDHSTPLAAVPA